METYLHVIYCKIKGMHKLMFFAYSIRVFEIYIYKLSKLATMINLLYATLFCTAYFLVDQKMSEVYFIKSIPTAGGLTHVEC